MYNCKTHRAGFFQNIVYIQGKKSWQCWSNGLEALAMNVRYNHALMCLLELVGLFSNLYGGPTPEICLSVLQVSTPSRGELQHLNIYNQRDHHFSKFNQTFLIYMQKHAVIKIKRHFLSK